jgi:hypothetical protein
MVELSERDQGLMKAVIDTFGPAIVALEKQVSELQARLAEVERKGYVGVWKADREYSPQSEVTHDGARWFAHKRTSDKPGTSADWQLMEKSAPTPSPRNETAVATARNGSSHTMSRPRTP